MLFSKWTLLLFVYVCESSSCMFVCLVIINSTLFSILYVLRCWYCTQDGTSALIPAIMQPSNYETRSISLATMNAWNLLYSYLYVPQRYIAVSFNKCTLCKSLWIKASAKCPTCKCQMIHSYDFTLCAAPDIEQTLGDVPYVSKVILQLHQDTWCHH